MSNPKEYNIIIPVELRPRPDANEQVVAELMAKHFKSDIKFIKRENTATTPDILVLRYNQRWEIKHIRGNSKRTIQNNLRTADNQSPNIILSLSMTNMTETQVLGRIKEFYRLGPVKIRKLLLITKTQKVLVVRRRM